MPPPPWLHPSSCCFCHRAPSLVAVSVWASFLLFKSPYELPGGVDLAALVLPKVLYALVVCCAKDLYVDLFTACASLCFSFTHPYKTVLLTSPAVSIRAGVGLACCRVYLGVCEARYKLAFAGSCETIGFTI